MIQEDLISYETALLAKSKGFNIPTIDYFKQDAGYMVIPGTSEKHERGKWVEEGLIISDDYYNQILTLEDFKSDWNNVEIDEQCKKYYYLDLISRPTQALLAKWLRDVHKLGVFVDCTTYVPEGSKLNNSYYWFITDVEYRGIYNVDDLESEYYDTYEQALEEGLKAALKLI